MKKEQLENKLYNYMMANDGYGAYQLDNHIMMNLIKSAIDGGYFSGEPKKVDTTHPNGLPINWDNENNT